MGPAGSLTEDEFCGEMCLQNSRPWGTDVIATKEAIAKGFRRIAVTGAGGLQESRGLKEILGIMKDKVKAQEASNKGAQRDSPDVGVALATAVIPQGQIGRKILKPLKILEDSWRQCPEASTREDKIAELQQCQPAS